MLVILSAGVSPEDSLISISLIMSEHEKKIITDFPPTVSCHDGYSTEICPTEAATAYSVVCCYYGCADVEALSKGIGSLPTDARRRTVAHLYYI